MSCFKSDFKSKILLKLKDLSQQYTRDSYWNISWIQGEFLSKIVSKEKPLMVLEFGTSNGFSTLWMAKELDENSLIYTIEVNDKRFDEAKENFNFCSINNIKQIKGEILKVLESRKFEFSFDFIFMDAMQKDYLKLIKLLEEKNLLSKDFTLVADNVLSHKNMDVFLDYMSKNYFCEIVDIGGGFLISRPFDK